jgi:hypothetical protein
MRKDPNVLSALKKDAQSLTSGFSISRCTKKPMEAMLSIDVTMKVVIKLTVANQTSLFINAFTLATGHLSADSAPRHFLQVETVRSMRELTQKSL